jgi:small subunit ribosomal protein S6
MNKRYECLLALDTRGQEDSVKEIIERLEAELTAEGAAVEQVQKMDKRPLAYSPRHIDAAYYVNFIFEADPSLIGKLRSKFKLDPVIFLQHYQQLPQAAAVRASRE